MKNRRIYKPLAAIIVIGVLLFYIDTRESIVFSRLPKEVARSASRIGSRALAQQDIAFHLSFRKGGPFEWIGQESVIRSGVEVKSFDGLWGGSFDGHQRTFLLTDRNWLDLGESFSLSVLVKLDSSSDHQEIMFARAQGAQIGIKLDNGKMTFFVPGESGVQITYYDFAHYDELVMVTAVADADSSSISLYQNGKLMSSSAFHFTRGIQHPIAIGSRNWRAVRDPLHGVLFSATAWRRALHANEVASLCARNRVTPRDLSRQHYAAWRFYDMMENIMKASLSVLDYFSVFLHEGRVLDADLPELNLFVRNATLRSMNAHHQSSLMSGRRVAAAADPQKIAYAFENMVGDGLLLLEGGNDAYVTGKRPGYILHTDSENPFMGLQNIRLLPPDEVGFLHPLLEAAVARRLGIPHIQNGFCILRINGTFVGVYYYEDYSTKGIVAGFSENLHLGPTHPHDWRSVFRDQVNRVYGLNRLALQDEIPLDAKELLSLYERLLDDKAGLLYNDLHSGISSREVKYRLRQYREKLHQIWPLASSELSRSRIYKDALREYLLLGSNPSPFYVISDLDLSVFHDRDIDITWESSDESVIGSQGKVRRPKDGVPVEVEMVAVIGCGAAVSAPRSAARQGGSVAGEAGDLGPVARGECRFRRNPASAHADHVGQRQIGRRARRVDPAGGAEPDLRQRRGQRLERCGAADRLGRKELLHGVAAIHQRHRLGRGGGAGQQRQRLGHAGVDHRRGAAGRHPEARARSARGAHILGGEQGARADGRALDRRHRGDGLQRAGGAQGHLEHAQPAGDQRLGQRAGVGGVLDHQHGDHGGDRADLRGKRALLLGGHGGSCGWGVSAIGIRPAACVQASGAHVPRAGAPLDRRRVQPVDVQFVADLLEHPQLGLVQRAIGGGDIAGQRIGGFGQPFGQVGAQQREERVQPLLMLEELEHRLGHGAGAIGVVVGEDRQVVHNRLDRHQLGGADVGIGRRHRDHDRDKAILRGERRRGMGEGHGRNPSATALSY